jgi:hypothetical protein
MAACFAVLVVAGLAAIAVNTPAAGSATKRLLTGYCNPTNPTHYIYYPYGLGQGAGTASCDTTRTFDFTVRLYNASGSILGQKSGSDTGMTAQEITPTVGCSGAYVHGFIYVNYNGTGQSNTETTAQLC